MISFYAETSWGFLKCFTCINIAVYNWNVFSILHVMSSLLQNDEKESSETIMKLYTANDLLWTRTPCGQELT